MRMNSTRNLLDGKRLQDHLVRNILDRCICIDDAARFRKLYSASLATGDRREICLAIFFGCELDESFESRHDVVLHTVEKEDPSERSELFDI